MIDVVYLAYFNEKIGYNIKVVEDFINSYKKNPAGIKHKFNIIAKNWTNLNEYQKLKNLAKENKAEIIDLPDDGFDIGAYFRAAKLLKNEYVFYIGSNINIEQKNWLLHLYNAFLSDDCIQLAGPMGSWAKGFYEKFPNPHIRTNSFLVKRELFLEYAQTHDFPETKADTWEVEHGEKSLSNFITQKRFKLAVVNSDGKIFQQNDWINSQTYVTREESKLLLSDKWARRYIQADEILQRRIEADVWGKCLEKFPKRIEKQFSDGINIFIPYADFLSIFSTKIFHPIFIGEINSQIETDALQDNTGINIADKVLRYGEMSAYYWVWKNLLETIPSPYVGFYQANRFLDIENKSNILSTTKPLYINSFLNIYENYTESNILKFIEGYDVVLPEKFLLEKTVYEEWMEDCSKEDFDITIDTIKEIYPEYTDSIAKTMGAKSMYIFGNFLMKKEIMSEFFQWLFKILQATETKIDWQKYGNYKDMLSSVFFCERLLNIWLDYNTENNNLKIKPTNGFMLYFDMQEFLKKTLEEIERLKKQGKKG